MLPAHIAQNIRKQVLFYLQSTFTFRDKGVDRAFLRFLEDTENGLFKGPWAQLRRPFRPASENVDIPFDIQVGLHPHLHQYKSWKRLSSKGKKPEPTIVTTGTGSGKTECFLYPILDHCLREIKKGQKGIKAIILYPMNALAADQEKRFADVIWNNPMLRQSGIRVGNYTGRYDTSDSNLSHDSGTKLMGKDHGISNHEVQLESPPDILLTNYRMLDFLLMRPQDQNLWRFNQPGVLRYLVLDELHTYDGAQGSDVACLIRRLKERLGISKGDLCVVGTSATLDERSPRKDSTCSQQDGSIDAIETSKDRLATFASKLFEEDITVEAVIGEDRLDVDEIAHPDPIELILPSPADCEPMEGEDALQYTQRQSALWGGPTYCSPMDEDEKALDKWRIELGDWLKKTKLFRYTLEIFHKAEQEKKDPLSWADMVNGLSHLELGFSAYKELEDREKIIASFFSLIAHAYDSRGEHVFPLIPSQVQLWIRELRRLGRVVSDVPAFAWLDEPPPGKRCLPVFHCSECGESGWIALHDPSKDSFVQAKGVNGWQLIDDPTTIYREWFGRKGEKSPRIVVICPARNEESSNIELLDLQMTFDEGHHYLCSNSLILRKGDGPCPVTGDMQRFRVLVNNDVRKLPEGGAVGDQGCPHCKSKTGLFFIGSQSATLSSVIIDEMFGSVLNDDPKLLAFTDSVQDASHRAGFFTARTYHFTFRTALQHVIDQAGEAGLSLMDVGKRLLEYWSEKQLGRPGNIKDAIAALIPPDLQQYPAYLEYRNDKSRVEPPQRLREEIEARLTWEAISEFGLMKTHGRTMEQAGSSCLGWTEEIVSQTISRIRERLPGIHPYLVDLPDSAFRLWIYGILHRYREKGSLSHPYLIPYAQKNYWGKFPFGRMVGQRETFPPATRYKPSLIGTHPSREHEWFLAPSKGSRTTWPLVWSRRVLPVPDIEESALLDLLRCLLHAGEATGLFHKIHQDGVNELFVLCSDAAVLYANSMHFRCSETDRSLVRPLLEANIWNQAPSIEYYATVGIYQPNEFNPRQRYYQDRYRKGALRRVVAQEHTGLLETEERESLENRFKNKAAHADDPNILTCTSTLEMGIDIGQLSSTMLCSIPPSTANYLQRIGRAGRKTGTALIVSVVNQRPHDLFFYARPIEMLKGKIDPPGCWLDASAVLVRQYLGYCFDCATKGGKLKEIPRNGKQFVDDMRSKEGHIPQMMSWVMVNEQELQNAFLKRFKDNLRDDTRERFFEDTNTETILQRIHQAANEFDRMLKDLNNARNRLNTQLNALDGEEEEARLEILQELGVLKGRVNSLGRTSTLEILTDHGLLPNYAFPERGVRFYGSVYNKYKKEGEEIKPIEVIRPARAALKELAPANNFYTHSRNFEIQQIAIGNPQEPLTEWLAVCGNCGHIRPVEELSQPEATTDCPQCGYDRDSFSQHDVSQHHLFIEFPKSQALSHMEYYESLSGDRDEERQREFYNVLPSFDHTVKSTVGAVGNDSLPFGIEYRSSMRMNEINTGFSGDPGTFAIQFGPDMKVSDKGFEVCKNCGVVVLPGYSKDKVQHRRSCHARKKYEKLKQEGRQGDPFEWENIYLYRTLRSEAIRLLLPSTDERDVATLNACIYLGLRLRFEGDPGHLVILPQQLSDAANPNLSQNYLILMDAVPGGTGYLKALFQEKDSFDREGEGVMDVLRRARDTLETCGCRKLIDREDLEDTDGCYRCIRSYHQQYNADLISRERGIQLLNQLIEAGEKRVKKQSLSDIKHDSLFESVLEKKFVDALKAFIEEKHGDWQETIIKGSIGFRFSLPQSNHLWELELQPILGIKDGVTIQSNPDFLLQADDDSIKPIAIFTDGFEYHCNPCNRLADDIRKRRALIESGNFWVWSITWEDLLLENSQVNMVCPPGIQQWLESLANAMGSNGNKVPSAKKVTRNGFEQLTEFILCPNESIWSQLAVSLAYIPLHALNERNRVNLTDLKVSIDLWSRGSGMGTMNPSPNGQLIYCDKIALSQDMVSFISVQNEATNNRKSLTALARLGDSDTEVTGSDYRERWRRFLACLNLYQFSGRLVFWTTSEAQNDCQPDIRFEDKSAVSAEWEQVIKCTASSIRVYLSEIASADVPIPVVEFYTDKISEEAFAEVAWPQLSEPICILVGDQAYFASKWKEIGWTVLTLDDLQSNRIAELKNRLIINTKEHNHGNVDVASTNP